jgi:hypothetical protein
MFWRASDFFSKIVQQIWKLILTWQKTIFGCLKAVHVRDFILVILFNKLGQHMSLVEYHIILKFRIMIPLLFFLGEVYSIYHKTRSNTFGKHTIHLFLDFKYLRNLVKGVLFYIFRRARIYVRKKTPKWTSWLIHTRKNNT